MYEPTTTVPLLTTATEPTTPIKSIGSSIGMDKIPIKPSVCWDREDIAAMNVVSAAKADEPKAMSPKKIHSFAGVIPIQSLNMNHVKMDSSA